VPSHSRLGQANDDSMKASAGDHNDEPWPVPSVAIDALDRAFRYLRNCKEPEVRSLANQVAYALATIEQVGRRGPTPR
jgi:hypothetical protein